MSEPNLSNLGPKNLQNNPPETNTQPSVTNAVQSSLTNAVQSPVVTRKKAILKNVEGKDMKEEDYFFKKTEKGGKAPDYFNKVCGLPVDREDLLEVFNKVFDKKDNILFYKTTNKEVYVVIVPLKYSTTVVDSNDSIDGDFQKHALSFIKEGSVNTDTMKLKLKRIVPFIKFSDR